MKERPFWIARIHAAWKKRPLVWLAGVRRVGKTTLVRMIPEAVYLNCDLPSVLHRLEDPELQAGATECSTCKLQMEQGADKPTLHPLKLLALAYGLMPEIEQQITALHDRRRKK